jgi:hypothetical protein
MDGLYSRRQAALLTGIPEPLLKVLVRAGHITPTVKSDRPGMPEAWTDEDIERLRPVAAAVTFLGNMNRMLAAIWVADEPVYVTQTGINYTANNIQPDGPHLKLR